MERLETKRLILRPWRAEDAADMYAYARDPRVGPITGWPVHGSVEESRDIAARFAEDDEVAALELKETGHVVGSIGLHRRDPEEATRDLPHREIGYCLHPDCWGQGLMPEAVEACIRHGFEDLGLALIWCGFYEGNHKSRRVVEKCGFSYRFTREAFVPLLGETRTEHFYALTRAEWLSRR